MTEPRFDEVQCLSPSGLHTMRWTEWGAADNPRVLLCVHALTRVSRDFDRLAREMAPHYRVVCPDVVGRGRSDWLRDPMAYGLPQYVEGEFRRYLECGILAHGFARARCGECGHDFSDRVFL